MSYAGFWKRVVANLIDTVITVLIAMVAGFFVGFGMGVAGASQEVIGIVGILTGLAIGIAYFTIMETSESQATLGKMALGIKVTNCAGGKITFGQALGRYFGKFLSGILLGIGFMMAGFTERKQGLHDMMAGSLVVSK